ncbi:hypothetical protein [Verrucomicrobium spinosum]|uniref:hypothetical protein n=1 Tax=Verrucomicrobium spinosum TaxID=2736 RepID=UPI00155DDCB9|nr:hypothetical protein [Verrucomicrobium spinosum]
MLEGLPEIQEISKAADSGDLVAARKLAEGLAAAQPLHEGAHFQLGLVLFQLGEWVKARQALKRSLYLRRDLAVAHYYLGLVQLGLGEFAGRSFQNARRLISRQDGVTVLPWGDGLTAGELRALLQPYHGAPRHMKPETERINWELVRQRMKEAEATLQRAFEQGRRSGRPFCCAVLPPWRKKRKRGGQTRRAPSKCFSCAWGIQ